MKAQRYYPFECVLIHPWEGNKEKLKFHTLLPSISKYLYDLSSPEISKVRLCFGLGDKPHNLKKKYRLIFLFGAMNLSRFSLCLVVGSSSTVAALFSLPLSKLSSNRFFFVFTSSAIFCLWIVWYWRRVTNTTMAVEERRHSICPISLT